MINKNSEIKLQYIFDDHLNPKQLNKTIKKKKKMKMRKNEKKKKKKITKIIEIS
jgi:hypothetical protein